MNARFARFAWLMAAIAIPTAAWAAEPGDKVEQIVGREIRSIWPANGAAGFAVAVRINGRTLFFNYGYADVASKRPVTADALFNLASIGKVFDATLLAQAIRQGELQLDDPVANFLAELEQGGDIRRVTIGQLATHTSGLLLPQDHPPWPEEHYTLPEFIRTLNEWKADAKHEPGKQRIYTHAGYILLHLAIERRFGAPIADLIQARVLRPLGLDSTSLPTGGDNPRGSLDPALRSRAVQGYDEDGAPIGAPGDVQGYYLWPGSAQMFSSARDMAAFVAANLGELENERPLQDAMQFAQQALIPAGPHRSQALAWDILGFGEQTIVEKNGGLNNSSIYIGMVKRAKLGIVILCNRGNQETVETGRRILLKLARQERLG